MSDFRAGRLSLPTGDPAPLLERLSRLGAIDREGWHRIDTRERDAGRMQGRPRVKIVDVRVQREIGRGD